ncbi:MAG: cytidine deaminase [Saprospiraceae bacterium]|nr:cytidine deaminase [Saprospiraceae bacterium]MCB9323091.1 cytidine deaminase [Lewinellaceae bacterium]
MKNISLTTSIAVYPSIEELPETLKVLLQKAKDGLVKSYSPYSEFRVSAALLLENGEILTGANQENAAYSMCLCAERVALAAATSEFPEVAVRAIAITVKNKNNPVTIPAAPCGACRQVLSETEDRFKNKIKILMQGESGDIYVLETAKDLLPLFFDGSFL